MRVPLNWLKEYVQIDISTDELVKRLTAIGHMQDKKPESIGDDIVIDLEVRQNRPDCLSVIGIAREVAAVTGKEVKIPKPTNVIPVKTGIQKDALIPDQVEDDKLNIVNNEPKMCYRFKAIRIKLGTENSKCKTPSWMIDRLTAYGIKTISPVVDITNYVMLEYGEPMHAFDASKIKDNQIIIRKAKDGEKLTILGGRDLVLSADDLVIADSEKILSFSGLIGGAQSGVNENSSNIVLEAATYNQAVIRRSSICHQVRTEASTRHEKFLHPKLAEVALDRAVQLVIEICGGEVVAIVDSFSEATNDLSIDLHLSEIQRLGGISLSIEDVSKYLSSLGFVVLDTQNLKVTISVPYWRTDILQEADLVEEVLRLHGYENIPSYLPSAPPPQNITSYWFKLENNIRNVLLQLGFDECITEPLTKQDKLNQLPDPNEKQILLQNALNCDKRALRTSLFEGLKYAMDYQKKFGKQQIKIFELGKIYGQNTTADHKYFERRQLGMMIYNDKHNTDDLYLSAKGIAETLFVELGYRFVDTDFHIQIIDTNTIFVYLEIEKVFAESMRNNSTNDKLYTSIPHIQQFDISFIVQIDTKVGLIINDLKDSISDLNSIQTVEMPRILNEQNKSVTLRFVLAENSTKKDQTLLKVSGILVDKYKATIR